MQKWGIMIQRALEQLEYYKIIDEIKSLAVSEAGQKLVQDLVPSDDIDRIKVSLLETTEASHILMKTASIPLQNLMGIEAIMAKFTKEICLNPEDFTSIASMLRNSKRLKSFMDNHVQLAPTISNYAYSMYTLDELVEEIEHCIRNNRVEDNASKNLEKIRKQIYIAEDRIKSKIDSILKSPNYKKYLQESVVSIKNDRYVIAVKSEYKTMIEGTIIDKSSTGSTYFVEPASIGKLHNELSSLRIDEENEIYQILYTLTELVRGYARELTCNVETWAYYDFLFAKGKDSRKIDGRSAEINYDGFTKIINGKHPLLGMDCVPLNFEIGKGYSALVITGPNTGGKTVVLKTVGLFTAMIQSGIHVTCDEGSHFSIYSQILIDVGDGQSIEQSLSTFSSHIKNIIEILKAANKYSLVILDEIGSGTDPTEGEGLAIAILKALYQKKATLIATSHYSEVKNFAAAAEGFKNGKMEFNIDTLKPTYMLTIGEAGESNAFIIALRLGMNRHIIEDAHKITYKEDKDYTAYDPANKVRRDKPIKKTPKAINRNKEIDSHSKDVSYSLGDVIFIHTIKQRGIICELENKNGELGIMVRDKKLYIHKKRISPFIEAKALYPENYDFDIVFKSVEYRKKNKLMKKRHVEGLTIELDKEINP